MVSRLLHDFFGHAHCLFSSITTLSELVLLKCPNMNTKKEAQTCCLIVTAKTLTNRKGEMGYNKDLTLS